MTDHKTKNLVRKIACLKLERKYKLNQIQQMSSVLLLNLGHLIDNSKKEILGNKISWVPNSLGELQQMPYKIEMLCVEVAQLSDVIKILESN